MPELSPEVESLLRELRSYLANSNDPWDARRELMLKINDLVPGGEVDLFVGTVREMGRIGTTYATMMQTFNQLLATQQAGANLADMFGKGLANPFMPPGMPSAAFDFFKQLGDFMTAQSKAFTKPEKK